MRQPLHRSRRAAWGLMVAACLGHGQALAAEPADITLELNKLEAGENGCRAYMVIDNRAETAFSAFKLDLVLFRPDGVIGKRLILDLAPVKPHKRSVKVFPVEGTPCDGFANILINDVSECRTDAGPVENCLARLELKSLSTAQLSK